jgi:YVTN family beta-propeller protein
MRKVLRVSVRRLIPALLLLAMACLALAQPAGKQVAVDTLPMAAALSPDGRYLLVLNAGFRPPSISVLDAAQQTELSRIPVADAWLGLAFSPKGDRVYAGGGSQAAVFEFTFGQGKLEAGRVFRVVDEARRTPQDFIGDVALSPDGRLIYAADLYHDSVVVINPQSGMIIERIKTGRRPYRILFHPDGKSFFVTSWSDGSLGHYQTDSGALLENVRIGAHPTDILWRNGAPAQAEGEVPWTARLFVAAANTNNVYSVGISAAKQLRVLETINVAMTPRQPLGSTPSALALSADGNRLYVVCSDSNAVAVVDITGERGVVTGFIPAGGYPTAARTLRDGRLAVLNGHGGSVSFVDALTESSLSEYSAAARARLPYRDTLLDNVIAPSPIQNVIYIVKGNLAYDQVTEQATPNQYKLARQFVRFDNFHGADGPGWPIAAIASDYMEKLWPSFSAGRRKLSDFEGQEPAALPDAGYLWTNAASAGISLRNYGFFVANRAQPTEDGVQVETVRDPTLRPVTNLRFRGPDPAYPDVDRARAFLADLATFEAAGQLPRLILMRLGSDRIADNDAALGMIVEGVSHSRFWAKSAIFVLETGGQHTPALIISPYTQRKVVDNTMYNTASMLRTIELILGMRPMTQFDAGARPMLAQFQSTPDPAPYATAR